MFISLFQVLKYIKKSIQDELEQKQNKGGEARKQQPMRWGMQTCVSWHALHCIELEEFQRLVHRGMQNHASRRTTLYVEKIKNLIFVIFLSSHLFCQAYKRKNMINC